MKGLHPRLRFALLAVALTAAPLLASAPTPRLLFEPNAGQASSEVRFLGDAGALKLYLAPSRAYLALGGGAGLDLRLLGANGAARLVGEEEQPARVSYLIGNDPSRWRSGLPTYARVRYREVYPGIDLVFYGTAGDLEFDFAVAPGADPGVIDLDLAGAEDVRLDGHGDALVRSGGRDVRIRRPFVYQQREGVRREVAACYTVRDGRIAFELSRYDRTAPLVIDPVVQVNVVETEHSNAFYAMSRDALDNTFLLGRTTSQADFPTTAGALTGGTGNIHTFVESHDPAGNLRWRATFGGSVLEFATDIAVDPGGHPIVTGTTYSGDFPTKNAFQPALGSSGRADAFLVKLASDGTAFEYATFFGGSGDDDSQALAVDRLGNAYIGGTTGSTNFPVSAAPLQRTSAGGNDAWAAKFDPAGRMQLSTYLGGLAADSLSGLALTPDGQLVLGGATLSMNFPVTDGSTLKGTNDAFVLVLSPDFKTIVGGRYLGGSGVEGFSTKVAVQPSGVIVVGGSTTSADFPTTPLAPWPTFSGKERIFVSQLFSKDLSLLSSTYVGVGADSDFLGGLKTGPAGTFAISGTASSPGTFDVNAFGKGGGGVLFWDGTAKTMRLSNIGLPSGTISALLVDPANPNVVYASLPGGYAKSNDGGRTWIPRTSLGTNGNALAKSGMSLYLGTDLGVSLSTNLGDSFGTPVNVAGNAAVRKALSLYAAPTELVVGTDAGLFGCSPTLTGCAAVPQLPALPIRAIRGGGNERLFFAVGNGVAFRDHGTYTMSTGLPALCVNDLAVDPRNPAVVYSVGCSSSRGTGGVFKSIDGGATFNLLAPSFVDLTRILVTPGAIYVGTAANNGIGLLKTDDGFTSVTDLGGRSWGIGAIATLDEAAVNILVGLQAGYSAFVAEFDERGQPLMASYFGFTDKSFGYGVGAAVALRSMEGAETKRRITTCGVGSYDGRKRQLGQMEERQPLAVVSIFADDDATAFEGCVVPGYRGPDTLKVEKTIVDDVAAPVAGQPITYRVKVTNISDQRSSSIDLRDYASVRLPSEKAPAGEQASEGIVHRKLSYDASKVDSCKVEIERQVRCSVKPLEPGESVTIEITLVPPAPAANFNNIAYASAIFPADLNDGAGAENHRFDYFAAVRHPVTVPGSTEPFITKVTPSAGLPGQQIVLDGYNLGDPKSVTFSGGAGTSLIYPQDDGRIVVVVPPTALSGPITVTTSSGTAKSLPFTVLPPVVQLAVFPPQISVSSTGVVTVTFQVGNNGPSAATDVQLGVTFTDPSGKPIAGTTSITSSASSACGGTPPCSIGGVSPFQIAGPGATVSVTVTFTPNDANASNNIYMMGTLTTPNEKNEGDKQVVKGRETYPAPAISSVTPASGAPGDKVEIKGTNLKPKLRRLPLALAPAASTTVRFGNVEAPIVSISDTSIVVEVPPGASSGPITVDTAGGTVRSSAPFTVSDGSSGSVTDFVAVVLATSGLNGSYFTTESTYTNRGPAALALTLTYTATAGGGSGTATDLVPAGSQRVIPDTIAYLKGLGIPIPDSGNRVGTLSIRVTGFRSPYDFAVTARTTTAVGGGRAGLAYASILTTSALSGPSYVYGLRQNDTDRSNVAVQHAGKASDGPITLRLTVFSGDDATSAVLPDIPLEPGGFSQVSGILSSNGLGLSNGYVRVERVSGTAPYYAYGVINDQVNSDGSLVLPVPVGSLAGVAGLTVPAMVEAGAFGSELIAANRSAARKTLQLTYVAGAIASPGSAVTTLVLEPAQQVIVPDYVQSLRDRGVAGIGPAGPAFAGALFVTVPGGDVDGVFVGVRVSAPGGGGRYGVFFGGVPYGRSSTTSAWIYGLQQNEENRTNLAIVNTGETDAGSDTFTIDLYDGSTGLLAASIPGVVLKAREWRQYGTILATYAPGVAQAFAHITRTAGTNPFIAYGVINDGARPGDRTGDGAFIQSSP